MELSKDSIQELMEIIKNETGNSLTLEEVKHLGMDLIEIIKLITT